MFGEGNFLRGFIGWMIHRLNRQGLFGGRIAAVQPTPHGKVVPKLNAQNGLYTVVLRGYEDGGSVDEAELIASISRGINPYKDWNEVLQLAENPEVRFAFSNTTEAGLSYSQEAYHGDASPLSFPGKLTAYLYHRYLKLGGTRDAGMVIFPCELVENNGTLLRRYVLQHADDWQLPDAFQEWVMNANTFCNTLVDRIVTGYPQEEAAEYRSRLGYDDRLLTVGEPYHLFAVDTGNADLNECIPFREGGLQVHWADVEPFRYLKVRILNGAHTMLFSAGHLASLETVKEVMDDPLLGKYVRRAVYNEINAVIQDERKEAFADAVIERFMNPYNRHMLLALGLNAVSKFKVRVLPTILDWQRQTGSLPPLGVFSFAALIAFYRINRMENGRYLAGIGEAAYEVREQPELMDALQRLWSSYDAEEDVRQLVSGVLGMENVWDMDLNQVEDLAEQVTLRLRQILQDGAAGTLQKLLT